MDRQYSLVERHGLPNTQSPNRLFLFSVFFLFLVSVFFVFHPFFFLLFWYFLEQWFLLSIFIFVFQTGFCFFVLSPLVFLFHVSSSLFFIFSLLLILLENTIKRSHRFNLQLSSYNWSWRKSHVIRRLGQTLRYQTKKERERRNVRMRRGNITEKARRK